MGRRASQQATFSKGALDPDLSERIDLEHYYDSLADAENSIFHPQGGFSDRGGFELISDTDIIASGVSRRLRRRIVPIPLTSGMVTAANGGVAGNLIDKNTGTVFTTNAVTATTFVLFEIDLGAPARVDFVDLNRYYSELLGADEAIAVQWWNGSAWVTFGDAIGVPTAKGIRVSASVVGSRTRRFGTTPGGPGGTPVTAQRWRAVALNAVGIGKVSIGQLMLWAETGALTPIRAVEFARDDANPFQLVFTERNVDVFRAQRYVASIQTPVSAQELPEITFAGGYDTMLVFHEMIETPVIEYQSGLGEWDCFPRVWDNVPTIPASAVFSASQDEIQEIDLSGFVAGNRIALFLGAVYAGEFTFSNAAALPNDIVTTLFGVPLLGTGTSNLSASITSGQIVRLRFIGANANRAWPLLSAIPVGRDDLQPATAIVQEGRLTTDTLFGAKTGFPRCGAFVQQRLWLAGFRSAPTSYAFSRNPTWYDFLTTGSPLTADLGFVGSLGVDKISTIQAVYEGRHLQMFTGAAEFWAQSGVLSATAPVSFQRATKQGARRGVAPVFGDGATLYVQDGGDTLREFLYLEAEQSYSSEPLSVLCPHLISDVVDIDVRPARRVADGNLLFLTNGDGSAAVLTTMRKQNVIAGAAWTTDGKFLSIVAGIDFEVRAVIERGADRYLERWTPDVPLDFCTRRTGSPTSTVTGAGHLEGRTDVWAIADDDVIGPLTVTGGTFTLPFAASDIAYGLLPPWSVRGNVLREKLQAAQPFRAPGRIYEMGLALKSTGAIRVGTNGQPHIEVSLLHSGSQLADAGPLASGGEPQLPMMQRLFTGEVTVQGLLGISKHPYFELSRAVPAPVHVKAIRYEISDKGD